MNCVNKTGGKIIPSKNKKNEEEGRRGNKASKEISNDMTKRSKIPPES